MNPKRVKTVVGLELGNRQLAAVELRRSGARQMEVRHVVHGALSLDPLSAAPELAAREISSLVREAGIRGSHCVVCLPLGKVLVNQVAIPEAIGEPDVGDFLTLEAERVFPFPPEDLVVTTSRYTDENGTRWATMAAMSASHLDSLVKTLRQAGLRPESITVGSAMLADLGGGAVESAIRATEDGGVELLVGVKGGVAALRQLHHPADSSNGGMASVDMESLVRELRITLGRLPQPMRDGIRRMRVFGPPEARHSLIEGLEHEVSSGVKLESVAVDSKARIAPSENGSAPVGATLAGERWLLGTKPAFEFLPPRVSPFQQILRRFSARGTAGKLAAIGGVLVAIFLVAYGWQLWTLHSLNQQFAVIEPDVRELEQIQEKIRTFRPWFDDSVQSLGILSALTQSFPAEGDVWTTSVEITDNLSTVECQGYTRSDEDYNAMIETLINTPGVENVESQRSGGQNGEPVSFQFSYSWKAEEANGR